MFNVRHCNKKQGPAGIGLAISAFSAVSQHIAAGEASSAAKDQAKEARLAQAAQGRKSEVEAQRAKIKQAREARVRRAQVTSATGNEGLGFSGTSGFVGGVAALSSDAANNVGNIQQDQGFAAEIGAHSQASAKFAGKSAEAGARAQQWQAIGSFGKSIFKAGGGFTSIFGGNTTDTAGEK